jgi:hypothetical protein
MDRKALLPEANQHRDAADEVRLPHRRNELMKRGNAVI